MTFSSKKKQRCCCTATFVLLAVICIWIRISDMIVACVNIFFDVTFAKIMQWVRRLPGRQIKRLLNTI